MTLGKAKLEYCKDKLHYYWDSLGNACSEGMRLLCILQGFLWMLIIAFYSLAGFVCLCRAYQKMEISFFEWQETSVFHWDASSSSWIGSTETRDKMAAAIAVSATKNVLLYNLSSMWSGKPLYQILVVDVCSACPGLHFYGL